MASFMITGAAGHLGNLLVRALLEQGHGVRALVHEHDLALSGVPAEIVRCDVREREAVKTALGGSDIVVHLAAKISLHARDAAAMLEVNVGGTRNVVAACRDHGARLVHVSSIHAFDPRPLDLAVDEDRALATAARHFAYDRSKALGEAEVRAGVDLGLDAIIVNPTAMLGPNDYGPSEMGGFVQALLAQKLPGLVAADFDWVDARDVAAMLIRLGCEGRRGARHLLSGTRASLPELARQICALGGVEAPSMVSPLWLAKATVPLALAWAGLRGKPPLYTSASLATLGHYRVIDGGRARRELGWAPRPLAATIADTVAWWQARA